MSEIAKICMIFGGRMSHKLAIFIKFFCKNVPNALTPTKPILVNNLNLMSVRMPLMHIRIGGTQNSVHYNFLQINLRFTKIFMNKTKC